METDEDNVTRTFELHLNELRFERGEIPDVTLMAGEVLVRVTCCTLCGSDLHTYTGRRPGHDRCLLGHEIIGTIENWNGVVPQDYQGRPLRQGQRITWSMAVGCGNCFYCQNDLGQKCERLFKYGHEPAGDRPVGGLSDQCVLVAGTPIFAIPDALSDHVACPANCATATVSAAMRLAAQTHVFAEATVVVAGLGMLGLTAAAQLSTLGVRHVIALDPDPRRIELALAFGATKGISAAHPDELHQAILERTSGRGADIAMDFSGNPNAVRACLGAVRTGGCVLLVGSTFPSEEIGIAPEDLVRRMLTLRGLHNYLPIDLDHALRFLSENHQRFPFEQLIERTFSLEETAAAFEFAEQEKPIRVAVRP